MSYKIQNDLLNVLNTISDSKKKTIYGASTSLIKKYPNASIFEFILILSYNKDIEINDQLKSLSTLNFYNEITNFKIKAYTLFIDFIKGTKFEDNNKVVEKLSELINSIRHDSIVLKYINIIKPLIEGLNKKTQLKMKLYIMIPNTYNIFYSEISKECDIFPKNASDFYSFSNIKNNTEAIKLFVEKNKNNYMALNEKISEIQSDLNRKYEELKLKNNEINLKYEELKLENKETNLKYEELNLKYNRLQQNLYQINFRDSIKSFLDELMAALNIFNPTSSSHTMKIDQIKIKINSLIKGLKDEEKKCADLLIKILDYLKTLNIQGDDLSHYFNNLGFDIDLLPKEVKEKYLLYGNGKTDYDCISLVAASLNGYIEEKEQKVLNQFLHDIYPKFKKNEEIIASIKMHSKLLL